MLTSELKLSIVENVVAQMTERMTTVKESLEQIEQMERQSGLNLVQGKWGYSGPFQIKPEQLVLVRKICGRLQVQSKYVPYDFDQTQEIIVNVKPMDKKWSHLSFSYRSKLRGKRCRVETHSSQYQTLVCKSE